jgi:hypothetical protein
MTRRSEQQNKYYFKCIVLLLGNELGYRKQEMHAVLLEKFAADRSKDMDPQEFDNYLEAIRSWAMADLGIRIPLPNEMD